RGIVTNRRLGLGLLCHRGPFPEERFQGNLAPDLAGAGKRWSEGQLRLRIVDSSRINAATIMPAYHRSDGLTRVAPAWRGKPILTAEQIEDVVAFLTTLKDGGTARRRVASSWWVRRPDSASARSSGSYPLTRPPRRCRRRSGRSSARLPSRRGGSSSSCRRSPRTATPCRSRSASRAR